MAGGWATEYESLNVGEAFAASFARWVQKIAGNSPAEAFLDGLADRLVPVPATGREHESLGARVRAGWRP